MTRKEPPNSKIWADMDYFDPVATQYRKTGKNRRKRQDPAYRGPERRLENRRRRIIKEIIRKLEEQLEA